jgi:FkbM family methyltransferase
MTGGVDPTRPLESARRRRAATWVRIRAWIWRFGTLPFVRARLASGGGPWLVNRSFAGRRLHLDLTRSDTHKLLWAEGVRYVLERRELLHRVEPGGLVVDVGANIGYMAMLIADEVGPSGRILCLEPVPENLHELRRNIELNRLDRIEVMPMAAGDRNGRVRIASGLNGVVSEHGGDLEVELRRLDSLDIPCPSLVKIDVEGYELAVLRGAARWLGEGRARWWIEVHPDLVSDPSDPWSILSLLESSGYPRLLAIRPRRAQGSVGKVVGRYLEIGILEQTEEPRRWLEEAERGGRRDPFWLIAEAKP